MASYYIPLPASEYPRNALLDFSPIRQAAQDWRQAEQQNYERRRQQEQMMYERKRNALADARAEQELGWKREDRDAPTYTKLDNSIVATYPHSDRRPEVVFSEPDPIAEMFKNRRQDPTSLPSDTLGPRKQSFTPNSSDTLTPLFQRVGETVDRGSTETMPNRSLETPANGSQRTVRMPDGSVLSEDDLSMMAFSKKPEVREGAKTMLERFKTPESGLSKESLNKIDEKRFSTAESLARLVQIQNTFKPEFLQWPTQAKQYGLHLKEKAGYSLTDEQKLSRSQYVDWGAKTVKNYNQVIHDLSGAAVSQFEEARLRLQEPNANDDPTEFETKLKEGIKAARLALYRYNYFAKRGLTNAEEIASKTSIEDFEKVMNARSSEIYKELKQNYPTLPAEKLKELLGQEVYKEFGGVDI